MMSDRLRTTFMTAMKAQHDGGRVEIHLGSDVIKHLKSLCVEQNPLWMGEPATVWGFPVVASTIAADHIGVHVVTVIHP